MGILFSLNQTYRNKEPMQDSSNTEQSSNTKKLIVFFHGFGFDKSNNKEAIQSICAAFPEYSYLGIDAPFPSQRERGGFAWFDIPKNNGDWVFDDGKLDHSLELAETAIKNKLKEENLSWEDLIIIGRSQGSLMGILLASRNNTPCHSVICFGSRFKNCPQFELNSYPPILWFEMDTEISPREELDTYKDLQAKGANLTYLRGINSDHDFISPETVQDTILEIQKLNKETS